MKGLIEIYHASTERVEKPDCSLGRSNLDFGQGFYLTDIYEQAHMWAHRRALRNGGDAIINVYTLDREGLLSEARSKIFDSYDEEWLRFIVACRNGEPVWKDFDYIEGGVADDRIINTVTMYMQGYMPKDEALNRLRYLKPNNQICIISQSLLDKYLVFTDCITLDNNG